MILKRMILLCAFMIGSATAQAASLDTVEAVVGGPTIIDTGIGTAGGFGVSFAGGSGLLLDPTAAAVPLPVLTLATFGTLPDTFSANSVFDGSPVLFGNLLDINDGAGFVQGLFATSIGSSAASFGPLFRVTISSALFNDTTLDFPIQVTDFTASLLVESVEKVAPIPLPAGVWLLIAGLGGLVVMRRRSTA